MARFPFQILTARLLARGIPSRELRMVGDRHDNDLEPAQAHGGSTWRMGAHAEADGAGLAEAVREPQLQLGR